VHIRRFTIRAAASATLATVALVLAAPAGPAFGGTNKSAPSPYTISIDSVTPSYASASPTPIKVSGTLTNHSGAPATGLSVQMQTTAPAGVFQTPSAMSDYRTGTAFQESSAGSGYQVPGTVANGATVRWTATFTSASAGFSSFGVYGLEAQALTSSQTMAATDRTYLPYWPGSGSADRLKIAWVWPLIDSPRQGACWQTLTDNSLDQSLAQTGRLGTLLSVGAAHEASTKLTWAVDPALLSDAKVMTGSYSTGVTATCSGGTPHPASSAATQWISELTSETGTAGMFVTPYADVDVSALTHAGLESDLGTAYSLGQSVAAQIMPRSFDAIGWPADGVADQSVLTDMARAGNISTVLLNDSEMPLAGTTYSDAVASTTTGTGDKLKVLLTDQRLTSILSGSSGRTAASQFQVTQEFLAETAMVASEAPFIARSVVVAPPRSWNPSESVANQLLTMTASAPWLQPVALSQLASTSSPAGETRAQLADRQVPSNELSSAYITKVTGVRGSVSLYTSLLAHPTAGSVQRLHAAIAASQSSAWRGGAEAGGLQALHALSEFVVVRPQKNVKILKGLKETLAGPSGKLPVSVYNGLEEPIHVRVAVTDSRGLTISAPTSTFTVLAKQTQTTELSVRSAQMGTTIVTLQLVTEDGSPLPWTTEHVSVVSTRYGRAVLILIVAALGVVVLTSAARWTRKWMANGGAARTGGGGE
jgi:hypothetical protein